MAKKKRLGKATTEKPTKKGEAEYVTMEQFKRDMNLIVEKMREMNASIKESIDFYDEKFDNVAEDVRSNEGRINKLEDSMEKVSIELEQTELANGTDDENLGLEELEEKNMALGKPGKKSKKRVAKEVEPEEVVEEEGGRGGRPAQTYESCREIAEQLVSLDPAGEGKYGHLPENMRIAAAALGRVVIEAFDTYEDLEEEFDQEYIEQYNGIVENMEAEE